VGEQKAERPESVRLAAEVRRGLKHAVRTYTVIAYGFASLLK